MNLLMNMINASYSHLCLFVPCSSQQAFLLENVPCANVSCHSVGRTFNIHWDQSDLGAIQNAVMATFFDIYEDVSKFGRLKLKNLDEEGKKSIKNILCLEIFFVAQCSVN